MPGNLARPCVRHGRSPPRRGAFGVAAVCKGEEGWRHAIRAVERGVSALPRVGRRRCWTKRMITGAPSGRCTALGVVGEGEQGEERRKEPPCCTRCTVNRRGERKGWSESTKNEPAVHRPRREPKTAVHPHPSPLPGRWVEPSARPRPRNVGPAANWTIATRPS